LAHDIVGMVLAAGQGTRMKSQMPKVLHQLAGKPMVSYIIDAAKGAGVHRFFCVVGKNRSQIVEVLGEDVEYVVQEEQLGTGHALLQTADSLATVSSEFALVLYGDTPLLTSDILEELIAMHIKSQAVATVLSVELTDPSGYGRIVRDGTKMSIVEDSDVDEEQRRITEVNSGIYVFNKGLMLKYLPQISADNEQQEYYLVDIFSLLQDDGYPVYVHKIDDDSAIRGVNDRSQLAKAEAIIRQRIRDKWLLNGVTLIDPDTTYIDAEAIIGQDTVIEPFTFIRGKTEIGYGCRLGPNANIVDSTLGNNVIVGQSVVEESTIGDSVNIGPFNHLRPGTILANGVKVGNFAEIKNSSIGQGSKVPHHSYLGNAEIGETVNIGAGVITVNYDGKSKHQTIIEEGAFIGCNANLIAPLHIGKRSYVAAGSTLNKSVPEDSLAIAREKQSNIEGWVKRKR